MQHGEPQPCAGGRQQIGEVIGPECKPAVTGERLEPALLRQMIEAVVIAEKIPSGLAAAGNVIARPVEPVADKRQSTRYDPFFRWPHHPQRQVAFALTEADLARFADEFDAQAGLLSLK